MQRMSKWLKKVLFGFWGLLLVPLTAPVFKKWLEENVFSDPNDMAATAFRNAAATPAFNHLLALGQQPWFKLALVFLTGIVVRSEEHTSELQSPDHLVCRLLLEKKKLIQ